MSETTSRKLWPDLIKIYAIYSVVTLHTLFVYPQQISEYIFKLSEISIPLFVMLSGALLLGKSEKYGIFFKKRCVKVLIPWVAWTFIYMLFFFYVKKDAYILSTFFSDSSQALIFQWGKFFIMQFLTGLWFLPLIFSLYILTPILRIFVQNAKKIDIFYLLILWFILIILMPSILDAPIFPKWEPALIYAPIQYSGYFILGYFLMTKKDYKFLNLPGWSIIPILLLFAVLPINGFLDVGTMLGAVLMFIYIISFSMQIDGKINTKTRSLITSIGSASLGIYVIHSLVGYLVGGKILLFLSSVNLEIVYTLIIFSISVFMVIILKKIPLLRQIVP